MEATKHIDTEKAKTLACQISCNFDSITQIISTSAFIHVIGKQLDRVEERVENKIILQLGNQAKPNPTLEKPLVKLPTTRQTSLRSKDETALEVVT